MLAIKKNLEFENYLKQWIFCLFHAVPFVFAASFFSLENINFVEMLRCFIYLICLFVPLSVLLKISLTILKNGSEHKNILSIVFMIIAMIAVVFALIMLKSLFVEKLPFYLILILTIIKIAEVKFFVFNDNFFYIFFVFMFNTLAGILGFQLFFPSNLILSFLASAPLAAMITSVHAAEILRDIDFTKEEKKFKKLARLYTFLVIFAPAVFGVLLVSQVLTYYYQLPLLSMLCAYPLLKRLSKKEISSGLPHYFTFKASFVCFFFILMFIIAACLAYHDPFSLVKVVTKS